MRFFDIIINLLIVLFFVLEKSGIKDGYVYVFIVIYEGEKNILFYDLDKVLLILILLKFNDI